MLKPYRRHVPIIIATLAAGLTVGCTGGGAPPTQDVVPQAGLRSASAGFAASTNSSSSETMRGCEDHGLMGRPCPLVFTKRRRLWETMSPNTDFYKVTKNTCLMARNVKVVRYFDYGIFGVSPGEVNTGPYPSGTPCYITIRDGVTKHSFVLPVFVNIPRNA